MKFERDREHDLLYVHVAEGEFSETVEYEGNGDVINLDVDAEGNVLGAEFLAFEKSMSEHGGELEIPEKVRLRQPG